MKRLMLVLIMFLVSTGMAWASDEKTLTLDKCISIALKKSPLVRSSDLDVVIAGTSVDSSKGARFPRIDLNGSYMKLNQDAPYIAGQSMKIPAKYSDEVYSWGFFLRMPLYEGGRLQRQVKVSEIQQMISKARLEFTKQDLVANVTNTFNKILQLQQLRDARKDSLKAFEKLREDTALLLKAGRIANVDLLRVDVLLASEQQQLINVNEAIKRTKNTLAFLMGVDIGEIGDIEGTLDIGRGIDEVNITEAVEMRPDIIALKHKVEQDKKRIEIAASGRYPRIALTGDYGSRAGDGMHGNEEVWNAGIIASINIFDGGIISSEIRKENALYEKDVESLRLARLKAMLEINDALSSLREAEERLKVAEKALEQAKETLEIEEVKYKTGAGTITDVLMAQSSLSNAQANYYQGLYDYNAATTEYRRATGTTEVKR